MESPAFYLSRALEPPMTVLEHVVADARVQEHAERTLRESGCLLGTEAAGGFGRKEVTQASERLRRLLCSKQRRVT